MINKTYTHSKGIKGLVQNINWVLMIKKNLPIEADCTQTKRKSWTEQSNEKFI